MSYQCHFSTDDIFVLLFRTHEFDFVPVVASPYKNYLQQKIPGIC